MSTEKVLVLGATGNLGAYSALALKRAGFDVVAAGHRKSDNSFFVDRGIPYYSFDITQKEEFDCLLGEGITTVVDFAGELPSRNAFNPERLLRSITNATLNVLEFMRKTGAYKIVFPTTPYDLYYLHETGKPIDSDARRSFPVSNDHGIYAIAKNAAVDLIEYYHETYNISRFILRYFTIYQYHPNAYHYADHKMRKMPYRNLMDKASKGETISVYGNPHRVKEMVYIKDFTKVVVEAVKSPLEGGIYNIGSPERVSLDEMIRGIVEVFAQNENYSKISYDAGKPDTLQSMLDWTKTKEELNYCPEYDLKKMLLDFKKEMLEEPLSQLWGTSDYYEELYSKNK